MPLGMFLLAFLLRWPTFVNRLFDPDEAAIGVQAIVVRHGGTLYADVFDRKPPLPPLAYAASFAATSSTDVRPMRVVVTIALAAAGTLVALDARRRHGTAAGWWAGGLLIAGAMALFPADAGAANYAHFALLPGVATILWSRRRGVGWSIGAGVALGVAILCRQSWLLGVVPAAIAAFRVTRWRGAATLAAAAAATVLTTGLYAPLGGFWEWNVANSAGFVFAPAGLGASLVRGAGSTAGFLVFHLVVVTAAAVAFHRRRPWRAAGRADLDLWLWLLVGLAATGAGLRFFGHYWLQVLPPLIILAAPVVAGLSRRVQAAAAGLTVVGAVVTFVFLFVPGSFHHRPSPNALAAFVDTHTTHDQRVFVWGSYPEVLLRADRQPAGALVHSDFVTGRSGGRNDPATTLADATPDALHLLLTSLHEHPPQLVVDTSTSGRLGYARYPLSIVPDVEAFVTAGYHRVAAIDDVTVWERGPPG